MPRIEHVTFRGGRDSTAQADVVVDGVEYRSLILRRHRSKVYVAWPRSTKLARSTRRRLEPKIIRALDQWRDLCGLTGINPAAGMTLVPYRDDAS